MFYWCDKILSKTVLRKQAKKQMQALDVKDRAYISNMLCKKFLESNAYANASVIMAYAPLSYEWDIWPVLHRILADNKTLVLAQMQGNILVPKQVNNLQNLLQNSWWILEPRANDLEVPLHNIDVILVPGLLFSRDGDRLGHGMGCYDRLLSDIGKNTQRISLCAEFQVVWDLPTEQHDRQIIPWIWV